ncbi:phospholipase D-like domain-containing protein [Mycoplasma crocodyli]|uniref:Cardiolipin synthetase n=1 Tax=Mycoplasma crocodyli (strain ATCC 51981 / MP145) TaxID=512564 RepID=D5E596_MYCCM|nr:phospholipase D-like domain-containing protein [Mycoplasma crocodyli]ADE19613.1 cardiolipin synthetase [Mycoplasma crocodyli MP145]
MNKHALNYWKVWIIWILELFIVLLYITGTFLLIFIVSSYYLFLAIIVYFLFNVITGSIIFKQQRQHSSRLSWLLITILLPFIGNVLFFTFGLRYKNKRESSLMVSQEYNYSNILQENFDNSYFNQNSKLNKIQSISETINMPAKFEIFSEGYYFYKEIFKEIKNAEKSINLVTYIIKPSETCDEFISLLEQKAADGVKINWLIDSFGVTFMSKRALKKLLSYPNVSIKYIGKIYYPFIHSASFYRNHQKFIVIDNTKVFSGGNNISDEYASFSAKYGHWIDLNYTIEGTYVIQYIIHFAFLWDVFKKEKIDIDHDINSILAKNVHKTDDAFLVFDSPVLNYSRAENYWIKLFSEAKKSIKISTPYFSVTESLWKQLFIAIKCGIEVEIYFPDLPDKKLVHAVGIRTLKDLSDLGAKIYFYKDHFLHSKFGIIDDNIAWMGTNNFDSRSMFAQYETMDIVSGNSVVKLNKIFDEYKYRSELFQNSKYSKIKYSKIKKIFYKLIKPLI